MAYHRSRSGSQLQSLLEYEYSTGNLIGHGAFALVFKGRRKRTLEAVAIKQISLKSVPGRLSNIRQKEIAILKEVKHSNVVQLYDYHEEHSHIYLVMEYCNGGDLGDYLQAKQTLSEDSIRHLTSHITRALSTIHQLHIIHRDIKPQNLLLSYPPLALTGSGGSGGSGRRDRPIREATVKLADFGFARYLTGTDMAATLCGSPLYMAPEILLGERYDSKADLWSVGTILYQCLAGTAPFLATNPHALRKRYEREKLIAKIPEGTSRYLASLLTQLLKKNPNERLSHEELCAHSFLRDPSIQASGYLLMAPQPPRTKSSPVPIRRHTPTPSPSPSPYNSRHSASPRQSPFDASETHLSPSSGPPSIHPVGSASSLARQQSPHSDITDHGFILVGASPHRSSSSPHSSTASSSRSGSYCSCHSHTHSPAGHTPSSANHTPSSSYGSASLHKYRNLITPFYQAPPTSRSSNGSMSLVKVSDVTAHSPSHHGEPQQPRPRSRSNSTRRRSSDPMMGGAPFSQTPPFGKLMQLTDMPTSVQSPYTSPYATLSRHTSSSPSPTSLTVSPSSSKPSPSQITGASSGGRLTSHVLRYSLSAHGSGSKLSSLAEQAEIDTHEHRSSNKPEGRKKPEKTEKSSGSIHRVDSGHRLDDLITMSQVLGSDEDEENFPLSLSLHSSQSSNKTDEQEEEEMTTGGQVGGGDARKQSVEPLAPNRGERCRSAGSGRRGGGVRVRRAASFSRQQSNPLAEDLELIRSRAASLSAHQNMLESDSTLTPTTLKQYDFQLSPAAKIRPMPLPFLLPSPSSSSTATTSRPSSSNDHRGSDATENVDHPDALDIHPSHFSLHEERREDEAVAVCLAPLRQAMVLARELLGMAKARQGPIMLLSTDLSSSGGASRAQRYSEQLVLYAKAVSVLDSGLRQFQIEMATSSMEPDQTLRTAEVEAGEMQESCLEKARRVREEMERMRGGTGHHHHPSHHHPSQVSAERLLLMEALDMCKHAVLNEQTGDSKECVKRYRIAKIIFSQLLSDARTHRDKTELQNYMVSVTRRIHRLTSL